MFSFSGRSSRSEWWGISITLFVTYLLLYALLLPVQVYNLHYNLGLNSDLYSNLRQPLQDAPEIDTFLWDYGSVVYLGSLVLLGLVSLSVSVRRWHDLGKSGWWVLTGAIPILGSLYQLVMLGFVPGEQNPNVYGEVAQASEDRSTERAMVIERKTVV